MKKLIFALALSFIFISCSKSNFSYKGNAEIYTTKDGTLLIEKESDNDDNIIITKKELVENLLNKTFEIKDEIGACDDRCLILYYNNKFLILVCSSFDNYYYCQEDFKYFSEDARKYLINLSKEWLKENKRLKENKCDDSCTPESTQYLNYFLILGILNRSIYE